MEDIIGKARRLGIKMDKKFERLAELQELLEEALAKLAGMEAAGENRYCKTASLTKFGTKSKRRRRNRIDAQAYLQACQYDARPGNH